MLQVRSNPLADYRVLFLSGLQLHPPVSGGTLRSAALADALSRRGVEVRVHSMTGRKADYLARRPSSVQVWPGGTREHVERGPTSALTWLAGYVLGLPPLWISAQLATAAALPGEALLPATVRSALVWCDAVLADFPFLHPVFSAPSARGKLRILSTHNVEHQLFDARRGWATRRLRARVRALEIRAAEACDILVSCCVEDARFFQANARVRQAVVVPNGVDGRRFRGIDTERAAMRRRLEIGDDVLLVLFTASKWGPNREAFEYLLRFARRQAALLRDERIHVLVVGSVTPEPLRMPGFTATGRVERVEPYFAAADAAVNPMLGGAGTNVKMGEFIAARLPVLSTEFGARGLSFEDGATGLLFEPDGLAAALARLRRLFDADPGRLRDMAARAFAQNQALVDMDACVQPLLHAIAGARSLRADPSPAVSTPARTLSETV
jgi:glycosyltransferase involved in cell wall biosynthesis